MSTTRLALTGALLTLLLVGCSSRSATPTTRQPAAQPAPAVQQANLPWGGMAHLEIAKSRDCDDLQSWFDSADFQRDVLLDRMGPDDPSYEYAFEVMQQAHERMGSIGCYGDSWGD